MMSPHSRRRHHMTILPYDHIKVQNSAVPEEYKKTTADHQQVELKQHLQRNKSNGGKKRAKGEVEVWSQARCER